MESEAAACASARSSEEDIEKVHYQLQQLHLRLHEPEVHFRHDASLHRAIVKGSGNFVFAWFF